MSATLLAIALAAAAPTAAPAATPTTAAATPLTAAQNRKIAECAATLLQARYVFPELGARYAALLRANTDRGDYAAFTDPAALGQRMTADLQAVHKDGHLNIHPVRPMHAQRPVAEGGAATPPPPQVAPGIIATKWAAPRVAYIAFDHFDDAPAALAAADKFFRDYAGARALVIDARAHRGGTFDMMGLLSNRLFARERHLVDMDVAQAVVDESGPPFPIDGKVMRRTAGPAGLVRFQHWSMPVADARWFDVPVYYLTAHRTYSAAEHMALVLKSTGRATLVGEATGGGNHFGGTEEIGGGLEMFVPIGRTSDPATGRDWEGSGVAPDIATPADRALDEALGRIAVR